MRLTRKSYHSEVKIDFCEVRGNYYDQRAAARAKCALNGYSVMPNHSPIILRTEPEWIASLSDFTRGQVRAAACRARRELAAIPVRRPKPDPEESSQSAKPSL